MKKSIIAILAIVSLAVSCVKPPVKVDKLEAVSETSMNLKAAGESADFEFVSTLEWTAKSSQDWVKVYPASGAGSESNQKLAIVAEKNASTDPREAKVTISAGEFPSIEVALNQLAADVIFEYSGIKAVSAPRAGFQFDVVFTTNSAWTLGAGVDWVKAEPASGSGSEEAQTAVVTISANESEAREATLTLAIKGAKEEIKIEQATGVILGGGKGTAEDPYKITNAEQFKEFLSLASEEDLSDKCFVQTADINLANTAIEPGCVSADKAFKGVYDGGNHTISSLTVVSTATENAPTGGFFRYTNGATIKNVKLLACDITGNCNLSTGGFIGVATNSTVENCSIKGAVSSTITYCGGFVGHQKGGVIKNCRLEEDSQVTTNTSSGAGIVAIMIDNALVEDCVVDGIVSSKANYAGGIVAYMNHGTVRNCVLTSKGALMAYGYHGGGIAGALESKADNTSCTIDNCSVFGNVSCSYSGGGLVGYLNPVNAGNTFNIINSQVVGGEVVSKTVNTNGYAVLGGAFGWVGKASTSKGTINAVNLLIAPSVVWGGFPPYGSTANEVLDKVHKSGGVVGTFVGYESDNQFNATSCYSPLGADELMCLGVRAVDAVLAANKYGFIGQQFASKVAVDHCAWESSIPFGYREGTLSSFATASSALSLSQMKDGTLLARLNEGATAYNSKNTGLKAKTWVAGKDGLPVLEGLPENASRQIENKIRVSVIGDSISTFIGWIPGGYSTYYPSGDVNNAKQTYWYRLAYDNMTNAVIDKNIAWSGSLVCAAPNSAYSTEHWWNQDFVARFIARGMGNPDVILLHGGTNDTASRGVNAGVKLLGSYAVEGSSVPTDAEFTALFTSVDSKVTRPDIEALPDHTFLEAYCKLLALMHQQYPKAKVVMIIGDWIPSGAQKSLQKVAEHYGTLYGYKAVDLCAWNGFKQSTGSKIEKVEAGNCHPSSAGHKAMADYIFQQVGSYINVK